MIDLSNYFVLIQSVRTMESGENGTSKPTRVTAKTRLICSGARFVIKGFMRIVTQSLRTPIIIKKPINALFWLLLNLTVSRGHKNPFPGERRRQPGCV